MRNKAESTEKLPRNAYLLKHSAAGMAVDIHQFMRSDCSLPGNRAYSRLSGERNACDEQPSCVNLDKYRFVPALQM